MSFFSGSTRMDSRRQNRRRSESESGIGNKRERTKDRVAVIDFEETKDVATAICTEIAKATLLCPDMNTGNFFRAVGVSAMDLTKSDATIVISAAILKHLGNNRMHERMLKKSATCSKYFEELGLNNEKVKAMFTTMLFALNPNFSSMLNISLTTALKRLADSPVSPTPNDEIKAAVNSLARSDTVSVKEACDAIRGVTGTRDVTLLRSNSIQTTPTDMVHPDDSVTSVGSIPRSRKYFNDNHMMEYLSRKKRGPEPAFHEVFKSAAEPLPFNIKVDKHGIGYKARVKTDTNALAAINNILGSHSIPSLNIATGEVRSRRPKVEDYVESEALSEAALFQPPEGSQANWSNLDRTKFRPPSPSDFDLPDSLVTTKEVPSRSLNSKDSYEELMDSLNLT